jgi:hypothetical protein
LFLWGGGQPLGAQQGFNLNPRLNPKFSPWNNLNRLGTDQAVNLYGLVRPEFAFRGAIQNLQQQGTALAAQQQELGAAVGLPPTGHPTGFMTQSKYFMTKGARGAAAAAPAPPAGQKVKGSRR